MAEAIKSAKQQAQNAAKTAIARNQAKQDVIKARMNAGKAQHMMKKPQPRVK